jgi:hypothetical protein
MPDINEVMVTVPPGARSGLVLGLHSSLTFTPGGRDPRALGVLLDRVDFEAEGRPHPPRSSWIAATVAGAVVAGAIAVADLGIWLTIGIAAAVTGMVATLVVRGFGPFGDYNQTVIRVGIAIGVALLIALEWPWRRQRPSRFFRFAVAWSGAVLLIKLLTLFHPDMPIGDALFHAHRFEGVLRGNLYFTSVAPGGYTFPYPPGLYIVAAAFKTLVHRGPADMTLLRVVTTVADALAGLSLYVIAAREWDDPLAGAFAVVAYTLVPLDFSVMSTGNLTNGFAQAFAVVSLTLMASRVAGGWAGAIALTAVLSLAYLSHTSTFAILVAATICTSMLGLLHRDRRVRRQAAMVLAASGAATVAAVGLYYSHFMPTYRAEFARIAHETSTRAAYVGGATMTDRLKAVPYFVRYCFGIPMVLLAAAGAVVVAMVRRTGQPVVAIAGWLAACGAFLALGIMTPIDMRYYLAAIPAVAVLVGAAVAWAWRDGVGRLRGKLLHTAVAVVLAAATYRGLETWWNSLAAR